MRRQPGRRAGQQREIRQPRHLPRHAAGQLVERGQCVVVEQRLEPAASTSAVCT